MKLLYSSFDRLLCQIPTETHFLINIQERYQKTKVILPRITPFWLTKHAPTCPSVRMVNLEYLQHLKMNTTLFYDPSEKYIQNCHKRKASYITLSNL